MLFTPKSKSESREPVGARACRACMAASGIAEHPAGIAEHPAGTAEHPAGIAEHPAGLCLLLEWEQGRILELFI